MTEWGVVLVIIALIGLMATIISPIIKLNTTITKLNITIDSLHEVVKESKSKIDDHETRILKIECHEREKEDKKYGQ